MSDWVKTEQGWKQTGGNGVSQEEVDRVKADLNNKQDLITSTNKLPYANISGTPTIPTKLSDLSADSTHRVVTDAEKTAWNNKVDVGTGNNTKSAFMTFNSANKPYFRVVKNDNTQKQVVFNGTDILMQSSTDGTTWVNDGRCYDNTVNRVTDYNLTSTNATIVNSWLYISGKTAELLFGYKPTSSWASGSTISLQIDKYKPIGTTTGCSFLGANGIVGAFRNSGVIDLRNVGATSIGTTTEMVISFTYLLA